MTGNQPEISPLPLAGIRVLDLGRILAAPICTQFLGDYGADIIKIERPGSGDDTRKWGPPFVQDPKGNDTTESAYYLAANRNKRSIAIDITTSEGQNIIKQLLAKCDILVENYKVGGLEKYGLSYDQLKAEFPSLIYCSITGFGQTGPYAKRAGYDYLAQGMGGIMSLTGEADGAPHKVGVAVADVMCGMHALSAILAALHHRTQTGQGQHIDCSLLDSQVAWLVNEASSYLVSGNDPIRRGNEHPTIVPYKTFEAKDGYIILAIGNDSQFQSWCAAVGAEDLAKDSRFQKNKDRVTYREELYDLMPPYMLARTVSEWIELLESRGVPCGPVNTIPQVFDDPHVQARKMQISMPHPLAQDGKVSLTGSPVKFSATPVQYRHTPPLCGQHSKEILSELLGLNETEINQLQTNKIVE